MEAPGGAAPPEQTKEAPELEGLAPITLSVHGLVEKPHSALAEEEGGVPVSASGLLQVVERRQPLSSVSSLEVHFDLLDLTELTDMSDQELAEVFADSDEENVASEPPSGPHPHPHAAPRAGYLRSPSWTRMRGEPPGREKQPLSEDSSFGRRAADPLPVAEKPKDD